MTVTQVGETATPFVLGFIVTGVIVPPPLRREAAPGTGSGFAQTQAVELSAR